MTEKRGKEPLPQVQWKEEKRVLTLEKIPVLELDLSFPPADRGRQGRGADQPLLPEAGGGLAEPLGPGDLLERLSGFGPLPGGVPALPTLGCPALRRGPLSG